MNKANNHLIEQIKQKIGGSAADKLLDILPLSKEAIYRRLRGDVLFTLDEAVIVARELNISLDTINTNARLGNFCTFELTMPHFKDNPTNAYAKSMYNIARIIEDNRLESATFFQVRPSLPPYWVLDYSDLFKFNYLRWLYLARGRLPFSYKYSDIIIPDTLHEAKNIFSTSMNSTDITILLSESVFEYQLKEIEHFYKLNILSKDDIRLLTDSMHKFINDIEQKIAIGLSQDGHTFTVYLTDNIQDTTFGFTERAKVNIAMIKFLDFDQGVTQNEDIYALLRNTFYDMKGYATLITESGSAKRTAFFARQRAIIDEFILKYS